MNPSVGGWGESTPKTNAFDGSLSTPAGTATTNANITWNCGSFPLSGQLLFMPRHHLKARLLCGSTLWRHHNYYGCYTNPDISNYAAYEFEEFTGISQVFVSQNDPSYGVGAVSAFVLNGSVIDNQPIIPSTVLNFSPLVDVQSGRRR